MTLNELVSAADVAALRPLDAEESARATVLLRYACAVLRARLPQLEQQVTAGRVEAALVTPVLAGMVVRALRNPEGVKSSTAGPFSTSFDERVAAGRVFVLDEELALLAPARQGSWPVGSIRLGAALAPDDVSCPW